MMIAIQSADDMMKLGAKLGALLNGGECIELVGDVGAGKTTFTKGIANGMGVDEDVQSPSFTISRVYDALNGLRLAHYDFYRLHDAGIMADELHEVAYAPGTITVIEWAEIVSDVLPSDRLRLEFTSNGENTRTILVRADGEASKKLCEELTR